MHLLFISNEYPPPAVGGQGVVVQLLARGLVRSGHQATVVGVQRQADTAVEMDDGVRVVRLPGQGDRPWSPLDDARRLWSLIRHLIATRAVDAVEGDELSFHLSPRRLGVPRVIRMHGGHAFFADATGAHLNPAVRLLEHRSFRRSDHLLAVSNHVGEKTRALLRLGDRPITVIANGVDTDRLRPPADPTPIPGRILFVGRYVEKKGIRELVSAMPEIVRRCPSAHLVAVGPEGITDHGALFRSLRSELPPHLQDHVDLRGPVPNSAVHELLAEAEVCALPSHMEAHPVAWLEALACGKALVGSITGPGPEVVEHGVSGLLADPYDPGSIADQVSAVLGSEEIRRSLERGARRRAVEHFSVQHMIEKTIEFYDRLIVG